MDGRGNLVRTWIVREKSGNLKINGYGRQSSENLFILFKGEKDIHSHEMSKPISLSLWATHKGKNLLRLGAN